MTTKFFLKIAFTLFAVMVLFTSCEKEEAPSSFDTLTLEEVDHQLTDETIVLTYLTTLKKSVLQGSNLDEAILSIGNKSKDINLYCASLIISTDGATNIVLPSDLEAEEISSQVANNLETRDWGDSAYKFQKIGQKKTRFSGCGSWWKKITKYKTKKVTNCGGPSYEIRWRCDYDCN
jgi:hypothetical protein